MSTRERWGSQLGFTLAAIGWAVGLGNIWRFPYLTGANGGGAFLLIYILIAVVIGVPLFTAEISLGRRTQKTPGAGMRALAGTRSPWRLIAWLGVGAAFLIMAYYQLIMGWIAAYFFRAFGAGFHETNPEAVAASYHEFTAQPLLVLAYAVPVMLLAGFILMRGLRAGIERAARVLTPILFFFLVALAIVSMQFDGAAAGVAWYLKPDFSAVTSATWLAALGQVFYSIGIGMAGAFVFGSYLDPERSDVPGSAATIVVCDTIAAVLAGLVLFPALFAFGIDPDQGPGLLFITMTGLFAHLPASDLAGGLFFFLIFVAGFTSGLGLIETLAGTAMDSFGWSRRRAVWMVLGGLLATGVPIAMGFGPWSALQVAGRSLFDLADYVSGNLFLTLGGLGTALYVATVWGFDRFREETNVGSGRFRVTGVWGPVMRFVVPISVVIVVLVGIGVLG